MVKVCQMFSCPHATKNLLQHSMPMPQALAKKKQPQANIFALWVLFFFSSSFWVVVVVQKQVASVLRGKNGGPDHQRAF